LAGADPDALLTDSQYAFPRSAVSLAEALAQGRALRSQLPRQAHATFAAVDRDPVEILADQHRTRLADLVPIRIGRMLQSPFAYYRGAAAVMARDLGAEVRTGVNVVVCGDAHVSNFGLFASAERRLLFDLNDFDEAAFGPWEWDVKRLVASAVVGGRQLGLSRSQCTDATLAAAAGYRQAFAYLFTLTALERFYYRVETDWLEQQVTGEDQRVVRRHIKKARRRTSDRVLATIATTDEGGELRIVDAFPIIRHDDPAIVERLAHLYDAYRLTVRTDVGLLLQQFRLVDTVLRIVGVGSVGTRCYIALLLGRADEPMFIQVKEAQPSVLTTYGGLTHSATYGAADNKSSREGWRVVAGQRILQAASDAFLGWVTNDGRDYYCRQFRDMKGSVELEALSPSQFGDYSRLCGAVLARAHVQSPDGGMIRGYLGSSPRFDEAITAWAHAYADQVERDFAALEQAVRHGHLPCEAGV
jgi:uncharacterized protein (DUF2252 family)